MTKKEKILETTLRLIAEHGVQSTPVSLISSESGVAIGTIYHHFSNKEEILSEILIEIRKNNMYLLEECIQNNDSKRKQYVAMWLGMYKRYINNPFVFYFTQYISNSKLIPEKAMNESEKYFKVLLDFFQEGIDNDDFINMSSRLITSLAHNSILTYVEIILNNQLEDSAKNLEDAIEFSWRAIRK